MYMTLVRTLSEIRREDIAGLLVRQRVQEVHVSLNDWGSILLPAATSVLQPWFLNANKVLASLIR
jgi:hypothetical protein